MTRTRQRYHQALNRLETLEQRTLLTASISTYSLPPMLAALDAYDSSGSLWVVDVNGPGGQALEKIAYDTSSSTHSVALTIPLDSSTYAPVAMVAGAGNQLYLADALGGIDVVDTTTGDVSQHLFASSPADTPTALAVTGSGAVWFVGSEGSPADENGVSTFTNTIGRFDPSDGSVEELTTLAYADANAFTLGASGTDSVWVAMDGAAQFTNLGFTIGHSHILSASFDGSVVHIDNSYAVNTGDPNADNFNFISSIVDGGGGTVWFTLGNSNVGQVLLTAPDQIVEGVVTGGDLVQTAHILPGADASTSLAPAGLTFDADNNLWFMEQQGPEFGYLNASGFTTFTNPGDQQAALAANPDGTQLSLATLGSDFVNGSPIVQIDLPAPTITFSGSAIDLSAREDTAINNTLLATFVAPTPVTGYTATITWGDSTTSVITPTALGDNTYAIVVNGKSFATQGTYNGTITINDGTATTGTLTFHSVIGDIPLNVTSLSVSPIILRIVTAVGTFTDDGDLALSTWTATINWGDSSTSTGLIVRDPTQSGRYLVLGLHQYRSRGTYTVRLTVNTSEANAAIQTNTLTTSVTAR